MTFAAQSGPFARILFVEFTQQSSLLNLPRVYSITLCSMYEHSGQQPTCGSGNSPLKLRRRDCHQHGDAFWLIFSHCLILMPQLTSENWIICSALHNWLFSAFGAVFLNQRGYLAPYWLQFMLFDYQSPDCFPHWLNFVEDFFLFIEHHRRLW